MQSTHHLATFVTAVVLPLVITLLPGEARLQDASLKLEQGDVLITHRKDGDIDYVEGRIRIHQPPARVWPILANPYEFEGKISPRFHTTQVLKDTKEVSLLKCRIDLGFMLPPINYTVESRYQQGRRISFQSSGGDLKDFRGYWGVQPAGGGAESDVTYSMFCQPGIPIPQWLVRQGIKFELPHTLTGLKRRVDAIYEHGQDPVKRTLAAAGSAPTI